ncbi:MAG: nitroreductase family protein [Thermomicrobiales bacterium]
MNRRQVAIGGAAIAVSVLGAGAVSVLRMGSMADFGAAAAALRAPLPAQPVPADLVRMATLAPNSHNTQAWRFVMDDGRVTISPDFARRTPAVDPDDHHLYVSLGCAAANLEIAGAAAGLPGAITWDPAGDGAVTFDYEAGPAQPAPLLDAILTRQSTRADYDGNPVSPADLTTLSAASATPGVDLLLITERAQIDQVRDLVVAGNSAQLADPAFVQELKAWLRFNPAQAMATRDGLFSAASGNPTLPTWLGGIAFDLTYHAESENARYVRQLDSSAGVAVFVGDTADAAHWVQVGQACQRFALQATALGLRTAFINQPVEVPAVRGQLAALLGLGEQRADIVMRFGAGAPLPYSLRRPVEAVTAA